MRTADTFAGERCHSFLVADLVSDSVCGQYEWQWQRLRPPVEAPTINYGVYQIGEVYARSWSTRVTSGPILMPKRTSSKAVQRGVGISTIRA